MAGGEGASVYPFFSGRGGGGGTKALNRSMFTVYVFWGKHRTGKEKVGRPGLPPGDLGISTTVHLELTLEIELIADIHAIEGEHIRVSGFERKSHFTAGRFGVLRQRGNRHIV